MGVSNTNSGVFYGRCNLVLRLRFKVARLLNVVRPFFFILVNINIVCIIRINTIIIIDNIVYVNNIQ